MRIAIIDKNTPDIAERELRRRGFYTIRTIPSGKIPAPLNSHPDMLIFKCGDTVVTSADYVEEACGFFEELSSLSTLKFRADACVLGAKYPHDCIYNALIIGDKAFLKTDTVSPAVIEALRGTGKKIIHVNQGYPACTVLPLGDGAAITADEGMARVLTSEGIKVTLIENGDIALPPYEYGFIGGAAGVLGDTVYFLGNPKTHKCAEKILRAIEDAGLRSVSLFDGGLIDLGRIIFAE